MKKRLFYYLLILALLGSCAALKPKREVVDNILSSSSPKMRVKVDPSLTYLGDIQYSTRSYADYEHGKLQHPQKVHAFVFVTAEKSMIRKALTIKIQKMKRKRYYTADQIGHIPATLNHSNLRLAGKRFQYYSKVVFPSLADPVIQYVYDNDYSFPLCGLKIHIVSVQDRGKTLIIFDYLEDIVDIQYDCTSSNWQSKVALGDKQRDLLDQINKNCMAAFEVLQ